MQIAQISQLRATPRATPKMMYYCACPSQTAARLFDKFDIANNEAWDRGEFDNFMVR